MELFSSLSPLDFLVGTPADRRFPLLFSFVRASTRGELRTPGSLLDNIYIALVRRLISCEDTGVEFLFRSHVM